MSQQQVSDALKMYRAYKTDSREYRELAEAIGISTAELNRRCWYLVRGQNY